VDTRGSSIGQVFSSIAFAKCQISQSKFPADVWLEVGAGCASRSRLVLATESANDGAGAKTSDSHLIRIRLQMNMGATWLLELLHRIAHGVAIAKLRRRVWHLSLSIEQ
jgi:hypothetical protein